MRVCAHVHKSGYWDLLFPDLTVIVVMYYKKTDMWCSGIVNLIKLQNWTEFSGSEDWVGICNVNCGSGLLVWRFICLIFHRWSNHNYVTALHVLLLRQQFSIALHCVPVCLRAGSSKHRAGPSANKTKSALEKGPGAGLRLSVLTFPGSVQHPWLQV